MKVSPQRSNKMKCTTLVNLLVASLVLGSSVVGCKHKIQNPYPVPRPGERPIPDDGARQPILTPPIIPPGPPLTPPEPPTPGPTFPPGPIPQKGDPRDWPQDRTVFADQTVHFDFDKAAIKPGDIPKLQTVAGKFKEMPGKALLIEGHCDERGTEEYNRALGERRALAVREKLVSFGVDASLIETISFGEDKPLDLGHGEAAWSKNRRGEIILLIPPGAK